MGGDVHDLARPSEPSLAGLSAVRVNEWELTSLPLGVVLSSDRPSSQCSPRSQGRLDFHVS